MHKYKILLTYNDPLTLRTIGWALTDRGCDVTSAPSIDEGIAALRKQHFDVVLTELGNNAKGGLSVLKEAKKVDPETIVILLGSGRPRDYDMEKLPCEADEYVFPPCRIAKVWKRVTNCLERLELKRKDTHSSLSRKQLVSLAKELELLGHDTYGKIEKRISEKLGAMLQTVNGLIANAGRPLPATGPYRLSSLPESKKRFKDTGSSPI